jgi:hypothetical protein
VELGEDHQVWKVSKSLLRVRQAVIISHPAKSAGPGIHFKMSRTKIKNKIEEATLP